MALLRGPNGGRRTWGAGSSAYFCRSLLRILPARVLRFSRVFEVFVMRMSRHRFILGLWGAACVALAAGCHRQTADDHLRKAEDYLAHSQLQEGVVELRLAEQADPKRGDVREKLADAYMR